MKRKILVTGAGSGLGEGAAIGLSREGHDVIAGVQTWQQVSALRNKAEELGLSLRVEKLDLLDQYEVNQATTWDFDILVNNAGIGEGGPIAEIPIEIVKHNFEINVFRPLEFTQRAVRKWVTSKIQGKVVFISSMGGLFSPPGFSAYASTKHAIEAIAEAMQVELKPYGIQVQTINPGAFLTGFNEAMAENALRWLNDDTNFTKRKDFQDLVTNLIGNAKGRLDPADMIAKMVEVIPAKEGKFRNVFPSAVEELLKKHQSEMYERVI
jgi:NAD(P)-dependent dehydrogenase (short-subunit alcohol dehydrogenase family)